MELGRSIFLLIFVPFSVFWLPAQNFFVRGIVKSYTDTTALPNANVVLLNPKDSSIVIGTLTNEKGFFNLQASAGEYILKISFVGFKNYLKMISLNKNTFVGIIKLQDAYTKEVVIEDKIPPVIQKGDTTQFNADAYKVDKNASAEDLVTKMPGITIQDGKVQAQGEEVRRVYVDGRPFFGDDANAVLRNVPAEMIDKVQIIDSKSDQSRITRFDDGNNTKMINIVTKSQYRNGQFGRFVAGYGTDNRYKLNATWNRFKGTKRLTILAQTNNINEQNFSMEDLAGIMGGGGNNRGGGPGRFMGRWGGPPSGFNIPRGLNFGGDNTFLVANSNGVIQTHAIGINFNDKINKKLDLSTSYFFNWSDIDADSKLLRQFILPSDSGLVYIQNETKDTRNINHRFNARIEYKIDSLNSILLQPRVSIQNNHLENSFTGNSRQNQQLVNTTRSRNDNINLASNISMPILLTHLFKHYGRTLTINLSPTYNQTHGRNYLLSKNIFYSTLYTISDSLNQLADNDRQGLNANGNITYTEAVAKYHFLQATYTYTHNFNNTDKITNNYNYAVGAYTLRDTTLSNVLHNTYISHNFNGAYRFENQKMQLTAGLAYQQAFLNNNQQYPQVYKINRTFTNILPNAIFEYKISDKKNYRLVYRTRTNVPEIYELQEVINNTNPTQLTIGNTRLKQDFQHNIFTRYSTSSTQTLQGLFIGGAFTITDNYIGNSTIIAKNDTVIFDDFLLRAGTQITQPTNFKIGEYFSIRSFGNYSVPFSKIKTNFNINYFVAFTQTPSLINYQKNLSQNTILNGGITLSSNISEYLDFTFSTNTTYNQVQNTLQKQLNTRFLNQNTRFKLNTTVKKRYIFQTEVSHQHNSGLTQAFNQDFILWTASTGIRFLKDNNGELKITVFDILKQNRAINRTATDTYIEDNQTNLLQRYIMLTFTYQFRKFNQNSMHEMPRVPH
ncbi:MAG: outer membrane beta-barrel protein [Bacteroidia bacterium]|nr:outer membrane beta-barrel protein [Bacteroidia bacterium]